MKTRGLVVVDGWIVPEHPQYGRGVPDPLWARLKHAIAKAGLRDAYEADYRTEREHALSSLPSYPSEKYVHTATAEERLFRRWAERVCGPQERWPWESGWTEEAVDAFLVAPVVARSAA
jgi:hypothetical protein